MQPVRSMPSVAANTEDNRQAFWTDVMRIAVQGQDRPASLTEDEIRRICQLALVAVPKRVVLAGSAAMVRNRVPH